MEEDEYRSTYHDFNQTRCVFEKAILSRQCGCRHSHKFCLAEREGIACQDNHQQRRCMNFLDMVRVKAQFILKHIRPGEPLPHGKEIRIQLGSLRGLATKLEIPIKDNKIEDIDSLLIQADQVYSGPGDYPVDTIIRTIKETQGRRKRHRGAKS